jgi:hypothetical protein
MASPNPNKTCGTCALGEPQIDTFFTCGNYKRVPQFDSTDAINCNVDNTNIISLGWSVPGLEGVWLDRYPKNASCGPCAGLLAATRSQVVCHLTNIALRKENSDWCGQWQPEGSF